jgi:hypothetical protein
MATTSDPARLAMLARVNAGELDHSAAAKELGLTPGVWELWWAKLAKGQGDGGGKAKAKPAARKRAARKAARKGGLEAGLIEAGGNWRQGAKPAGWGWNCFRTSRSAGRKTGESDGLIRGNGKAQRSP